MLVSLWDDCSAKIQTSQFRLKRTFGHTTLCPSGYLTVERLVGYFCIDSVSVVLGSDRAILDFYLRSFKFVAFHEFEEGLIAVHRGHFELVFVPVFIEATLDVAFTHVECVPVCFGTVRADKDTKGNVEHRALGI